MREEKSKQIKEDEYDQEFEIILKKALSAIGPEKSFPKEEKTYSFDGDLKFSSIFWDASYELYKHLLKTKKFEKQEFAYSTSGSIFEELLRQIVAEIKKRSITIEQSLDQYLVATDMDFARSLLDKLLSIIKDNYTVYLLTDLIVLKDQETVEVGKVTISKLTKTFLDRAPEQLEGIAKTLLGPLLTTPEDFVERNKNNVLLSVNVSGFHHGKEKSGALEKAVVEFKIAFSFLEMAANFFLRVNQEEEKKTVFIEREDLDAGNVWMGAEPSCMQKYYIHKTVSKGLQNIDTSWSREKINYSKKKIVLSSENVRAMQVRCYLTFFNKIMLRNENEELRNKIRRSLIWFLKSQFEEDETDKAINLFISLESLLSLTPDPTTGHTDELASNVAILSAIDTDTRYDLKREFKTDVYKLRSKIFHHGSVVDTDDHFGTMHIITCNYVWSLRGLLLRYEYITTKYGTDSAALREFLDREKLSGGTELKEILKPVIKKMTEETKINATRHSNSR